ncbi:RDD family protein [Nocardioides gilvus]|uniref:RDD family protein n=1 Tax=Nocardioides gilvus TaxID=1735589 RepID=UPI000D74C8B3|nr:RDD family protein [Nocardioides gilvus]
MIETASWGHRILALAIDWVGSILVVMAFIGLDGWIEDPASGLYTLGVFVLQSAILLALAGGSFGQLVTRLRVVRYDGVPRPVDLIRALVRQVLIALVIPPLVFRPDGRGLHDMAVGSAVVRLRDLQGAAR